MAQTTHLASFGPFFIFVGLRWPLWAFVLAAVGLRWPSLHFVGCHGRSLAAVDGRWLLWMVVGCCGWSLAAVDLSSPALAAVDLRWLLWAVVVAFVGVVQAKGGYVDVDVVSVVQRLTW